MIALASLLLTLAEPIDFLQALGDATAAVILGAGLAFGFPGPVLAYYYRRDKGTT